MVLTYTDTGCIYGTFELGDRHYKIESLESLSHVIWVEIDQSQFEDIEPEVDDSQLDVRDVERTEQLLALGRADQDKVAEYSITVYYTKAFKDATADPVTFAEQVMYDILKYVV